MINLPIGQVLIGSGLITEEQLKLALEEQHRSNNERLGDIMLKMGFITEVQYLNALSIRLGVQFVKDIITRSNEKALALVPYETAVKYAVMPLNVEGNILTIMTCDPLDFYSLDDIRIMTGMEIKTVLALRNTILSSIENCYSGSDKSKLVYDSDIMAVANDIFEYLDGKNYKNVTLKKNEDEINITIKL